MIGVEWLLWTPIGRVGFGKILKIATILAIVFVVENLFGDCVTNLLIWAGLLPSCRYHLQRGMEQPGSSRGS
jgi:hypothetical protein